MLNLILFFSARYANRAKNIKNNAKINEDPKDALMRQYQKEIEELKALLDTEGGDDEDEEEGETDDEVMTAKKVGL